MRAGLFLGLVLWVACAPEPLSPKATFSGREDHLAYFPIREAPHGDSVVCEACHGQADSFRQYSCTDGCHGQANTDSVHLGITAAYRYESQACYQCHPKGNGAPEERFEHARFFPIREGAAHFGLGCAVCHPDPGDRHQPDCARCHPAGALEAPHSNVGGYRFEPPSCLRCHADAQVHPVAAHLPFRIDSPTARHFRKPCTTCHPATRSDRPRAPDFSRFECLGCHDRPSLEPAHLGKSGYSFANASCVVSGCHADGELPR